MALVIHKALRSLTRQQGRNGGESRGTLSQFVINAPRQWGQPLPLQGDVSGLITLERMREIVMRTPTPAACVNAILDFACTVPVTIRAADPAEKLSTAKKKYIEDFLRRPAPQTNGYNMKKKLFRDMVTLGFGALEVERDEFGKPANLHVLDAARLRIDYDEHGMVLGYDMLDAHGRPISNGGINAWNPEDIIFFSMNPYSASDYSTSRFTQLFSCAMIEELMLNFIAGRFTESNAPFGVLDLGDITPDELEMAVANWNDQVDSGHKIMLTGSKNGSKWFPFGYHLKDLEAVQLLAEVRGKIMAILGVTMNELGESQDVSKSNGYNLSFTFKRRAIEPLLLCYTYTMSEDFVHRALQLEDAELGFEEIDSRDDLLQAEVDHTYWQMAVVTTNQIRNRRGDPSVEGGDEPFVVLGQNAIPLRLVSQLSEAQLMAILGIVQDEAEGAGQGGGEVSPPLIRAPASPMKWTTPMGSGSSSPKFRYPKPPGQQTRGPVQTLRSAGARTEQMQGK